MSNCRSLRGLKLRDRFSAARLAWVLVLAMASFGFYVPPAIALNSSNKAADLHPYSGLYLGRAARKRLRTCKFGAASSALLVGIHMFWSPNRGIGKVPCRSGIHKTLCVASPGSS